MADEDKKNIPVVRISIAAGVNQTRQISFETYVDALTPKEVIDSQVDKLMGVIDRQTAFYEIIDLEKLLRKAEDELEAMKGDLQRVDEMHAKKRTSDTTRLGYKLNPKEVAERHNVVQNIKVRTDYVERLKQDIEVRKLKVEIGSK